MTELKDHLERVSNDLATIEEATGLGELPITRADVGLNLFLTIVPLVMIYAFFAARFAAKFEIPWQFIVGTVVFFAGAIALVLSHTSRIRFEMMGGAVTLLVAGMVIPYLRSDRDFLVAMGVTVAIAGLAGAAIQIVQLRRSRANHAAH